MSVIIIIPKSPCSRTLIPFFSIEKSQNILYGFPGKFYEKMSKIILFVIYRELVMWLRGDFLHEWIFTRDIVLGHLSWQYDLLSLVSKSPALQKYTGIFAFP